MNDELAKDFGAETLGCAQVKGKIFDNEGPQNAEKKARNQCWTRLCGAIPSRYPIAWFRTSLKHTADASRQSCSSGIDVNKTSMTGKRYLRTSGPR